MWFFGTPNAEVVVFCLQWVVAEIFWLLLYDRLSRRRLSFSHSGCRSPKAPRAPLIEGSEDVR
jgi:hypothetical protein